MSHRISSDQFGPVRTAKSVQEVSKQNVQAHTGRFPKTDVRYWQQAIFRPTYSRAGERVEVADWAVKIQHRGRRETFSLDTPNRVAAAAKARDIYQQVIGAGWDAAIEKWKPAMQRKLKPTRIATVGEFLVAVSTASTIKPKTLEGYAKAFRMTVAQIAGIKSGKERFDYRTGGHRRWLDAVHAVGLERVTPASVQKWKAAFLRHAKADPLSQKTARVSANSFIRNAKALFSPKLLALVSDLNLPTPLPFEGITSEKVGSLRYRSTMQAETLLLSARRELTATEPEQYKIFILALLAGLRRNEIDKLMWRSVDFARGVIRIEATEFFQPKSEDSAGDVEVDPEVLDVLRAFKKSAKGEFVIESSTAPRLGVTFNHYRAEKSFKRLNVWLRSKGVTGRAPLHVLRKEFGSLMNDKFGIHAASRALRHSRLEVTSAFYVDVKTRRTLGLGGILTKDLAGPSSGSSDEACRS